MKPDIKKVLHPDDTQAFAFCTHKSCVEDPNRKGIRLDLAVGGGGKLRTIPIVSLCRPLGQSIDDALRAAQEHLVNHHQGDLDVMVGIFGVRVHRFNR